LIDVREVVSGLAGSVFIVNADFIVKNGVKTDVFEIRDAFRLAQIVPVAFAERPNIFSQK
jgi:hypothetical protein